MGLLSVALAIPRQSRGLNCAIKHRAVGLAAFALATHPGGTGVGSSSHVAYVLYSLQRTRLLTSFAGPAPAGTNPANLYFLCGLSRLNH